MEELKNETKATSEMTDEQLDKVKSELKEIKDSSDELKLVDSIKNSTGDEKLEDESEVVNVKVDHITGQTFETNEKSQDNKFSFEDCLDGLPDSIYDVKIDEADIDALSTEFKTNTHEMNELIKIAKRYQAKENFSVFEALPNTIRASITKELAENGVNNKNARKLFAENLITEILNSIAIDKYQVEFNKAMKDTFSDDIPEISDSVYKDIETRKEKMYKVAVELREKGYEEKANTFEQIGDMVEESFKYEKFKEAIKNHSIKIRKIDLEKYNRVFKEFNYKYEKSVYSITTVEAIPSILGRVLPYDYSNEDIIKFVVAFCKYCTNMKPENPVEHTFMYYFIYSIVILDLKSSDDNEDHSSFKTNLIENIMQTIDLLNEVYK